MANENSKIEYESGVTPFLMAAITDSGDHKTFTTQAELFSETPGNAPVILPDGVINGGIVTPTATDDEVAVTAVLCNLGGQEISIAAGTLILSRAANDVAVINSIVIDANRNLNYEVGTDSVDSSFSAVRGDPGGPPYIPVGAIEIGQVRFTGNASAVVLKTEIFQIENAHREMANYPSFEPDNFAGTVIFEQALPLIHDGATTKSVYASYAEPVFSEQRYANDFVPAEIAYSSSSTQVYGATIGSVTESLGKCTFTAILKNGITDPILEKKGQTIFIRYYQDRYKLPHIISQGKISFARSFGAAADPKVTCTLAVTKASVERAS